uniref:Ig-like domain-containing protein n=1 Tax=Amphilophus citrinellus TaxID=61819 RepID=A0A3Q0SNW5_AMPCI
GASASVPSTPLIFFCSFENLLFLSVLCLSVWPVKVEVKEGAESVLLPFKTTKNLPKDVQVLWDRYDPFENAHVYQKGFDQPDKQSDAYRGRTRVSEDLLRTGVLSLTLMRPTERDSGEYKCLFNCSIILTVTSWLFIRELNRISLIQEKTFQDYQIWITCNLTGQKEEPKFTQRILNSVVNNLC